MDPARVVEILNEYFSKMVSIIFHNRGTLDKFIGDAIMAFWGAPIVRPDHAWLAVKTALEMIQGLRELNRHWASRGIPPLAIGIGIHSGNVIVGNIGSDQRLDYTLIGDNVNLGSRLEGLTKQYGVEILLSETTLAQLNGRVAVRFLDLVTVKGKTVPVGIYEPLEENTYKGFTIQQVVSGFDRAFHAYRERRWEEAISLYGELAKTRDGDDKTARLMIERCEYYKNDPPEADWDGSFTMKTK